METSRSRRVSTRRRLALGPAVLLLVAASACRPLPGSLMSRVASRGTTSARAKCPSGACLPRNVPGWRLVFADDFKRAMPLGSFPGSVSTRWGAYRGTHDTSGHGMYVPGRVVSVHGGVLDIHLHTSDRTHMVAAVYPKVPGASSKDGFVRGRYVMRFRADETAGYKLVSLLWPDSGNNLRER